MLMESKMHLRILALLCALAGQAVAQDDQVLVLRAKSAQGQGRPQVQRLAVQATVLGSQGWTYRQELHPDYERAVEKGWRCFPVPSRVHEAHAVVWAPPHPLLEQKLDLETAGGRKVPLELAAPVPQHRLSIQVSGPDGQALEDVLILLLAPETGTWLDSIGHAEAKRHFDLPAGVYDLEVQAGPVPMCANSAPQSLDLPPLRRRVVLTGDQTVDAQLQAGVPLSLRVLSMDRDGDPDASATYPWQRPGDERMCAARLLPVGQGAPMETSWGWKSLALAFPEPEFPMDQLAYLIEPVPPGTYDLVIRSQGMREHRQRLVLKLGQSPVLEVRAQAPTKQR